MILYKYRDNSDNTNKIFTDKKVWLSNAKGLNDPFECTIQEIAKDWIEKEVVKLKSAQIEGFIFGALSSVRTKTNFYDLSHKATKGFLENFKKKRDFDHKYKTVVDFIKRKTGKEISNPENTFSNFDKQLNNVGIFSLSETCKNQLMWSHYGGNSKGIAIGFEKEEKLMNETHCLKVNYSDTLPKFDGKGFKNQVEFYATEPNITKISFEDNTFKSAISTKPTVWEYEKEWRYVEETSGLFDYPSRISEIVFGLNCPKEEKQKYRELIKLNFDYDIDFYDIIKIPNSNQIEKIRA